MKRDAQHNTTQHNIQLFKPHYHTNECLDEIRQCLDVGWTGLGYKTVEFEQQWKTYTGHPYAHFVNSATAGLHLAVKQLKMRFGWADGDEVISTPLTFVSSNHAILYEGLKVVFADVDETLCLNPADIEKKITPKTRAILFVGIGGNTGQYEAAVALARKHGLSFILDAAHMAGTRLNGRHVGAGADVVVYSFQAVKNLPTADAGMVCFMDAENDALCRKLTWLGINKDTYLRTHADGNYKWKYNVEYVGYKYHGNSIMAAIGLVELKYLDEGNAYRRQLAAWYDQKLRPAAEKVRCIPVAPGCTPSRHLYIIEVDKRDETMLALNKSGIYPGVHYRDNTEYPMYRYAAGTCPNAHRLHNRLISLPMHLELTEEDIGYICGELSRIVK